MKYVYTRTFPADALKRASDYRRVRDYSRGEFPPRTEAYDKQVGEGEGGKSRKA